MTLSLLLRGPLVGLNHGPGEGTSPAAGDFDGIPVAREAPVVRLMNDLSHGRGPGPRIPSHPQQGDNLRAARGMLGIRINQG